MRSEFIRRQCPSRRIAYRNRTCFTVFTDFFVQVRTIHYQHTDCFRVFNIKNFIGKNLYN
jgi:hypothetical protein